MSSEDEEDGPMSTETYQRLNENWELRQVPNRTYELKVGVKSKFNSRDLVWNRIKTENYCRI